MEAVSAVAVFMVVGSTREASAVALSTAVAVSMAVAFVGDVSPVAVSMAVAFVATVLVITDSLMMSSSAASAFRGGGAGTIRTDITVTTITRTITMDTAGTHIMDTAGTVTTVAPVMGIAMEAERIMDMDMAVGPVTDIAMSADQGMSGVRGVGDKPATAPCKIRDEATCESSKSGRSMFGDNFGE